MGAEVDSSCPCTVVAKNKWICTSAAPLCLHGIIIIIFIQLQLGWNPVAEVYNTYTANV